MARQVFCRRPGCGHSQEVMLGIMPTACWNCYQNGVREPAKWSTIPWNARVEPDPQRLFTPINHMDRRLLKAAGIAAES